MLVLFLIVFSMLPLPSIQENMLCDPQKWIPIKKAANEHHQLMEAYAFIIKNSEKINETFNKGNEVDEAIDKLNLNYQIQVRAGWPGHSVIVKAFSDLQFNVYSLEDEIKDQDKYETFKTYLRMPSFPLDIVKMKESLEVLLSKYPIHYPVIKKILKIVNSLQGLKYSTAEKDPLFLYKVEKLFSDNAKFVSKEVSCGPTQEKDLEAFELIPFFWYLAPTLIFPMVVITIFHLYEIVKTDCETRIYSIRKRNRR